MNLGLVCTANAIQQAGEIGFDSIDIVADPLEIDVVERKRIRDACREAGLAVNAVCCAALGIADFNRVVRRFHIDRCMEHLDLAYELEGRNLSLSIGEYLWQKQVVPPREQWEWAVEGVRELGEYAAPLGLCIAVEMEPSAMSLIHSLDDMNAFLCDADCAAVQANLNLSGLSSPEGLAKFAGRTAQVRLLNGEGDSRVLAEIRRIGLDGTVSVAVTAGQAAEAYRRAGALLRASA